MANVTLPLAVTISEEQRTKLVDMAGGIDVTDALSGLATAALRDLADGGHMLRPLTVKRLAGSVANAYDDEQIMQMAEKGARRFGESLVVEYVLDPIYVTPLEDIARGQGRDLKEVVTECMAICFQQGWFYNIEMPPHRTLIVTDEEYRRLCQAVGREVVSGHDIAEYLKPDEDPFEPEPQDREPADKQPVLLRAKKK